MIGHAAVAELRRKLIPVTLKHAVGRVPAYRAAYAGTAWEKVDSVLGFPALPLIDKQRVREAWHDFICPGLTLAHVQHTSGTTGEPLFLLRSVQEQRFITEFMGDMARKPPTPASMLALEEAYHGSSTGIPSHYRILKGSIVDDRAIETALRLLELPARIPDQLEAVRVLTGTDATVRALTHVAALKLQDPRAAGIQAIHTYGDLLPPSVRRRIERSWAAILIDRYSMVEHFGGAARLPGSDSYGFDPHIQPEVVHPSDGRQIRSGRGLLVLTSLYPFVQMMPMIRYATGDAVEITGCGEEYEGLEVRILGRLHECLADEEGLPILSPLEWRDALEEVPGIAFRSRRTDLTTPGLARAIGRPLARFRAASALALVEGEVGVEEGGDPAAAARMARTRILDCAPLLAERVRTGRTEFRIRALAAEAFSSEPPAAPAGPGSADRAR